MTQMVGAATEELLTLGGVLRDKAARVTEIRDSTSQIVNSLAWSGAVADDFVELWSVSHGPRFESAATFLIEAAETIARNAAEQMEASAGESAESAADGASLRQRLPEQFTDPEFSLIARQETLRAQMGDAELDGWLRNNGKLFKLLDGVVGGVGFMTDFLEDAAQHPQLPADERIVHAISEVALRYAADNGISEAMAWAGGAIAGLFTAGTGILVGKAVGRLVGEVATVGFHHLDDRYQVTDKGADVMLDGYRGVRDNPDPFLMAAPVVGPAVLAGTEVWGSAADMFPIIDEFGGSVTDAASASKDSFGSALTDLLDGTIEVLVD